jgi:hypothetical protein
MCDCYLAGYKDIIYAFLSSSPCSHTKASGSSRKPRKLILLLQIYSSPLYVITKYSLLPYMSLNTQIPLDIAYIGYCRFYILGTTLIDP